MSSHVKLVQTLHDYVYEFSSQFLVSVAENVGRAVDYLNKSFFILLRKKKFSVKI